MLQVAGYVLQVPGCWLLVSCRFEELQVPGCWLLVVVLGFEFGYEGAGCRYRFGGWAGVVKALL